MDNFNRMNKPVLQTNFLQYGLELFVMVNLSIYGELVFF